MLGDFWWGFFTGIGVVGVLYIGIVIGYNSRDCD